MSTVIDNFVIKPAPDEADVQSMALCIWKESRGTGLSGMLAVALVIRNRAVDWRKSIHDVIFEKSQFTSMSVVSDREYSLQPVAGDPYFAQAQAMAQSVLFGGQHDFTNGAHYYDNPKTATSPWFAENIVKNPVAHPRTGTFGGQDFYV